MDYKGYDLFLDVEDQELKARNRAVVLWNMYESKTENGLTDPAGMADMMGYVRKLPEEDRKAVINKLSTFIESGGTA